ncbi:MAG: hypothetical protein HW421_1899 [Ignavibacteria bacterium]|nr:hypothetical protein [Ignavibacteria bacterium]
METRTVVILLIVITVTSLALLGGAFYVYKYYPEKLGLPPNPTIQLKIDTVYAEPTIGIPKKKLEELERKQKEKEYVQKQRDSIIGVTKRLKDSISAIQKKMKSSADSIIRVNKHLSDWQKLSVVRLDSIMRNNTKIKEYLDRIETFKKKVEEQDIIITKKIDTNERKNFEFYAKLYNGTNPVEVAKILEQIDAQDASKILKLMSRKKAGKVVEAMVPSRAAMILLMGADE